MPEPPDPDTATRARPSLFPNPWRYFRELRHERFQRKRLELRSYLKDATEIALTADRLYREWRDAVSEPIQDGQKAANQSAAYWWSVTERLRAFEQLEPPRTARRYHELFGDALRSASRGSEIAKNGFRANKFSEVSRGLAFLDEYAEQMRHAESEMARLEKKYRLIENREQRTGNS